MEQINFTKEDEQYLRNTTSMKAFTLYIDEITKLKAQLRLQELGLDTKKGSLAALIRVLLRAFAEQDITIPPSLIKEEYLYTTKKNKRSTM